MAVSFQIDTTTMPRDPYSVEWEPKQVIDRTHSGAPIFNIKRTCRLFFDDMPTASYSTLLSYDDGAAHSVKIPRPSDGTYTTYTGAYFRATRSSLEDLNSYGSEFEVSWVEL